MSLWDYLPKKDEEMHNVQCLVPQDLVRKARKKMRKNRHSWADIVTAALRWYIEQPTQEHDVESQSKDDWSEKK